MSWTSTTAQQMVVQPGTTDSHYTSPDLITGTAGRLRFHLLFWDETAAPEHPCHAIEVGEALLASAGDAG